MEEVKPIVLEKSDFEKRGKSEKLSKSEFLGLYQKEESNTEKTAKVNSSAGAKRLIDIFMEKIKAAFLENRL